MRCTYILFWRDISGVISSLQDNTLFLALNLRYAFPMRTLSKQRKIEGSLQSRYASRNLRFNKNSIYHISHAFRRETQYPKNEKDCIRSVTL